VKNGRPAIPTQDAAVSRFEKRPARASAAGCGGFPEFEKRPWMAFFK
jgi:hypothetical protein